MHAARATNSYERQLAKLANIDLLIIDDFGLKPLKGIQDEDFHDVISERYERRSTIITSNLEFSQWNTVFGDSKLTAALIDRLIHHSHIMVFSGPGHRLEESMRRQKGGEAK